MDQQSDQAAKPFGTTLSNSAYNGPVLTGEFSLLTTLPKIELPHGGGTSHGRGETFAAYPVTGLAGILGERTSAWQYKPNLGDCHFGPSTITAARR